MAFVQCIEDQSGCNAHDVFDPQTVTRKEHFACQDSDVSQMFNLIISSGGKILSNIKVVVTRQVKRENNSLPVTICSSKTSGA